MKHVSTVLAAAVALGLFTVEARAQPDNGKGMTVTGRITQLQSEANQVTLKTDAGKEINLSVDGSSRLELGQKAARLNQFKPGQRVRVTYAQTSGKDRVQTMTDATTSAGDLNRKIRATLESAKKYTFQQRDEYKQKLQGVVHDVDQHMKDLEARTRQASGRAKEELSEQVRELRKKSGVLHEKLKQIGSTTAAAWDEFRTGVSNAVTDLGAAFERIHSRVKQ